MKILLIADSSPEALLDIQCVIQRLIQKHRECRISLMAPVRLHALAARLTGLDDLLALPEADAPLKVFWIAGRQLEEWQKSHEAFDQALVFTRRWKPALIPWLAGIPRRSGRLGRGRFMLVNDARWMSAGRFPDRRTQYLALADDHGELSAEPFSPRVSADSDKGRALMQEQHLTDERPALVFCPGGVVSAAQRWPVERWSALAAQLIEQGWQIWLVAPQSERGLCEQICAGLNLEQQMEISNLSGRLAWDDTLDLIALSRAVLAQETLYSQLTQALNHPLVVLQGAGLLPGASGIQEFAPVNPGQLNAVGQQLKAQVVHTDRKCQPCQDEVCRHNKGRASDPCIHELSVERVRSALLSMVPMQAVD